jgi:hypothetical protein
MRRRRVSAGLAVAATLIGVLAGATSLFDWFERRASPPPAPEVDARIVSVDLRSTGERLGDYLRAGKQSTAGLTRYELNEEGYTFAVRFRLMGNQDRVIPFRWSLLDAPRKQRLRDPIYNQSPVDFKPRDQNQAREWVTWVPYPPRSGTFVLRASLVDDEQLPLAQADSKPFRYRVPGIAAQRGRNQPS